MKATPSAFGTGINQVGVDLNDDYPIRLRPDELDQAGRVDLEDISAGYEVKEAKMLVVNLQAAIKVCEEELGDGEGSE